MIRVETSLTNTEYERIALANKINLSDGHARHSLSIRQREIVSNTLNFFDLTLSKKHGEIEKEFSELFFYCGGQDIFSRNNNIHYSYSSSSATKIVAQFCRQQKLNVCLIEPCFDNIRHIIHSEGINITAVQEDELYDLDFLKTRLNVDTALWLVQPNNPTGFCLDQTAFAKLVEVVKYCNATLIVDFCFRMYAKPLRDWDQYQIFNDSKLKFIGIEDTGKTWPLADTKVGITVCSTDSNSAIHKLHDELLLNVSPLHLLLLSEFIKDSIENGLENTVFYNIERNRSLLNQLLDKKLITRSSRHYQNVPLEILQLPDGLSVSLFWSRLRECGVEILPAHNYFWTNPSKGKSLFRIPLSRPCSEFETAIPIIEQTLINLTKI